MIKLRNACLNWEQKRDRAALGKMEKKARTGKCTRSGKVANATNYNIFYE